jgi:hypothetical protein
MDIPLLLSSLNASKNLVGSLVDERDRQKAAAIQIDLTNKIIEAQSQISEILAAIIDKDGRIQTLTERNRHLEAQQSEKARYRLAKLGTAGQFFAYQLRPVAELPERSDEPEHFVCQPCLEDGKKRVLLVGDDLAVCPGCNTSIPLHGGRRRTVVSQGINVR